MSQLTPHALRVTSLYRKSLKHSLSWAIDRDIWRQEALLLRARFDEAKNETNILKARQLLEEGEAEFERKKHPDPYTFPSAVDGSMYERNVPPPHECLKMTPQEEAWYYGTPEPPADSKGHGHH